MLSAVPDVVRGGDDSAVLSIGISFESNAHVAAVYAADLVRNRAKASELKVGLVSPPDITINFRKVRDIGMTVPLSFFEAAGTIYDYDGRAVRIDGVNVVAALKYRQKLTLTTGQPPPRQPERCATHLLFVRAGSCGCQAMS